MLDGFDSFLYFRSPFFHSSIFDCELKHSYLSIVPFRSDHQLHNTQIHTDPLDTQYPTTYTSKSLFFFFFYNTQSNDDNSLFQFFSFSFFQTSSLATFILSFDINPSPPCRQQKSLSISYANRKYYTIF